MEHSELEERLSVKIEAGNEVAIPYIQTFAEPGHRMHDTTENVVAIVLNHPQATNEMLDAACQAFCDIGTGGSWVYSLSHFVESLWVKRDQFPICSPWLARFYKMAFELANDGNDKSCNRLILCYERLARFDDNPSDFYLTLDNLSWMKWDSYSVKVRVWIEHGPFKSKNDLEICTALFALNNPQYLSYFNIRVKDYIIKMSAVQKKINFLTEHSIDVPKSNNLIRAEIKNAIKKVQTRLKEIPSLDWLESSKEDITNECQGILTELEEELLRLTTT